MGKVKDDPRQMGLVDKEGNHIHKPIVIKEIDDAHLEVSRIKYQIARLETKLSDAKEVLKTAVMKNKKKLEDNGGAYVSVDSKGLLKEIRIKPGEDIVSIVRSKARVYDPDEFEDVEDDG